MPSTPQYGLPFEALADEPGHSLHGGQLGTDPILAEEVETELERIDTDVTNLGDRTTAIEQNGVLGWTHIDWGVNVGSNFNIDVTKGGVFPAGTFGMLRLSGRWAVDGLGTVRLRINDETGIHNYSFFARDVEGELSGSDPDPDDHGTQENANQWVIARGAGDESQTFICTIFRTESASTCPMQSTFTRPFFSLPSNSQWGMAWGDLSESKLITSLNVRPFSDDANQFLSISWYLEGYKIP